MLRAWFYHKVIWPLFRWGFQWASKETVVEVQLGGAAPPQPFPGRG